MKPDRPDRPNQPQDAPSSEPGPQQEEPRASASLGRQEAPREAMPPGQDLAEQFGSTLPGQLGVTQVQVIPEEWELLKAVRRGGGLTVEDLTKIHDALGLAVERYDLIGAFDDEPGDEDGMRDEADEVQEAAVKLDVLFEPGKEPFRYGQ